MIALGRNVPVFARPHRREELALAAWLSTVSFVALRAADVKGNPDEQ